MRDVWVRDVWVRDAWVRGGIDNVLARRMDELYVCVVEVTMGMWGKQT